MKLIYSRPILKDLSQGSRIAFCRQFRIKTQDDIAKDLGITGECRRRTITRYEKEDINSLLFSTGIFWEGIDIEGPSLSNLIIARLPFPVADPILEYKSSLYGKDVFDKVYIPEMLIKLKQGVGRLIRSESDKGIVCILDSRMSKSEKYKDVVKRTLPIKRFVDNIDELKQFVEENKINVINDNI